MTHLPNGDRGGSNTPRLPVKWFGEDSHLTHWLERSRVTSFKVALEDRLLKDITVEDEDLPEYNGAVEHAIHQQTKWIQEKKREARKRAKISDPEYNPTAVKCLKYCMQLIIMHAFINSTINITEDHLQKERRT